MIQSNKEERRKMKTITIFFILIMGATLNASAYKVKINQNSAAIKVIDNKEYYWTEPSCGITTGGDSDRHATYNSLSKLWIFKNLGEIVGTVDSAEKELRVGDRIYSKGNYGSNGFHFLCISNYESM
jgi:hypothetical protein